MKSSFKVGCCGFPVSRLIYFSHFSLVEIQQTFYQPPLIATAQRWRSEAPDRFEFSLKAWQLITHEPTSPTYRRLKKRIPQRRLSCYGAFRSTDEVQEAWEMTERIAEILRSPVVLFQCPASFTDTFEHQRNFRRFFKKIRRRNIRFAWEPRGRSWASEVIQGLCQELDLIHCVDPFLQDPITQPVHYLRIHGGRGYTHRYLKEELLGLKERLRRWGGAGWIFFNNVSMWDDARNLQELLSF